LRLKDALAAFETLNRTPEFFRRFLDGYITNPDLGFEAALADTRGHVFNQSTHLSYWNGLLAADRELLRLLANGAAELHGAMRLPSGCASVVRNDPLAATKARILRAAARNRLRPSPRDYTQPRWRSMQVSSTSAPSRCHQLFAEKISTSL
jgi:hypothetical protein